MCKSICGTDCNECSLKDGCGGCAATKGRPFGGECVIAVCCQRKDRESCEGCSEALCSLREQLLSEFNSLGIEDMSEVTELFALKGSFVNLEYTFPGGQTVKLLKDDKIYLGNQICKRNSDRCYGLAADEKYLLVCEYGEGGSDAEIVVFKRRNG